MIVKERIIRHLIERKGQKFTKVKLQGEIIKTNSEKNNFEVALKELINEGIIVKTHKKKIMLNHNLDLFVGKFIYNPKGYGFCILTEKAKTPDTLRELFIPPSFIKNALSGDRVIARINRGSSNDKKAEGEVISILERNIETLVGTYMDNDTFGFVIPDNNKMNKDIYIPKDKSCNANSYDKVVVMITKYPEMDRNPEGIITEVLGFKGEQGVDLLSILMENDINPEFPPKVLAQVDKIPETLDQGELRRRKDLTNLNIFTIDGEDAKDLDDAISIRTLKNGNYELGVHIADVSHYVKEKSKIDNEAYARGTSVYLINKVIPMLPKKLSNNLCSLNPNSIKLTLSVFMEINNKGNVVNHKIVESYIKSTARLCYTEVSDFLEEKSNELAEKYPFIVEDIKVMESLARILQSKRMNRGALEFKFDEAKIILNDNEEPIDVTKYERRIANEIIEEFMLVTNETVAEDFFAKGIPFVYRVHENPREERLQEFINFVTLYGFETPMDIDNITPKELQDILAMAEDRPERQAVNLLLLQSMQQARYSPFPKGHFGLGCKFYSHFTSPIRRYPDLQIHRIIKEYLNGQINDRRKEELAGIVELSSKKSSKRERLAQSAEMEYDLIKKVEYMSKRIGDTYVGMITGLTNVGVTITLDNTIEGFLNIDRIQDDKYDLIREECTFIGQETGRKIMLGDMLKVSVSKVRIDNKEILFDFIDYVQ